MKVVHQKRGQKHGNYFEINRFSTWGGGGGVCEVFLWGFVRHWDGGDEGSKGKVPSMGGMHTYLKL